ncbi:MAG: L,D-transpeptidase family protein [bacterium]|nr:L,D-transpeptidase family protein [bacterium]
MIGKFVLIGSVGDRVGAIAESFAIPIFRISDFSLAEQIKPALLEANQLLVVIAEPKFWSSDWEQWIQALPGLKLFWGFGNPISETGPWLTVPVDEKNDAVWMLKGLFDAAAFAENVAKPMLTNAVSELLTPHAEVFVRKWLLPGESDREYFDVRVQQISAARVAIMMVDAQALQRLHPRIAALVGSYLRRSYPTPSDRDEEGREVFQAIVLQSQPTQPSIAIWYNRFASAKPMTRDDVKTTPESEPVIELQTIVPIPESVVQEISVVEETVPVPIPEGSIAEWEQTHSLEMISSDEKVPERLPENPQPPAFSTTPTGLRSWQPRPPAVIRSAALALDPDTAKLFADVERISEMEARWKPSDSENTTVTAYSKPGFPLRNILVPFAALLVLTIVFVLFSKNGSEASITPVRAAHETKNIEPTKQNATEANKEATTTPPIKAKQTELGVVLPPRELLKVAPGVAIVVVDKSADRLWVLKDNLILFETEVVTGGEHGDKQREGDRKTPEGVYYITKMKEGLGSEYGGIAMTLDYPNVLDRVENRNGGGIWLHGVPKTTLNEVFSTRGCVAMLTPNLRQLISLVKPYESLVYIREREPKSIPNWKSEVEQFLERWRTSWIERDIERYMACYAEKYAGDNGNFRQLRQHKGRVFQSVAKIEVGYTSLTIIVHGSYVVVHFRQRYHGEMNDGSVKEDNGLKRLFLQRDSDGFRIVSEEWIMQSTGAQEVANR